MFTDTVADNTAQFIIDCAVFVVSKMLMFDAPTHF